MDHQTQIQKPCFLLGEALIVANGVEEVLCQRQTGLGPVQVEAVVIEVVPLDRVGMRHNHGETGD